MHGSASSARRETPPPGSGGGSTRPRATRARPAPKPASTTAGKRKRTPGGQDKSISILLIDDNRLFRIGLSALLKKQAGLKLLAASERPEEIARPGRWHHPDVVLLDLGLSGSGSLEVSRGLRTAYPNAKLIVMGLIPLESEILPFVKEGVSGFLLKDASIGDFAAAIRSVAAGARVFPTSLTDSLLSQIVADAARKGRVRSADVKLSVREREIVDLIADGMSNKVIAKRLHIALDTVKSHVHNILEKLAVRSRVDIALHARTRSPHPR